MPPLLLGQSSDTGTDIYRDVYGGLQTRLLSSSLLGLPYKILNTNHKKELLRSLWVQLRLLPHGGSANPPA